MKLSQVVMVAALALSACAAGAQGRYAAVAAPSTGMAVAAAPPDDVGASGAAGPSSGGGPTVAIAGPAAAPTPAEAIVVEGTVALEVADVAAAAAALRAEVEAGGGRIADEQLDGGVAAWRAELKLRVAPERVAALLAWLGGQGTITDKRVTATDVSRTLFDRDLAIANKRAAMARLEDILQRGGATMADVLAIEQEMTRLRGELESLEGEQRYLRDRVGQATLSIVLRRRDGEVRVASANLYPGVRLAALTLLDAKGRPQSRLGVGLVAFTLLRAFSFEVDVFAAERGSATDTTASRAVIATLGGAGYSDFFGRGRRKFGNPYLGFRAGYAYLDGSRGAVQGEVGVELWKHRHGVIDLGVRVTGLIGKDTDVALVSGLGAAVAF